MRNVLSANVCGASIILIFAFATIQDDTGHVAIATPAPTSPSTISDLSNITIGMERNMCMGTCPVYSLEIFGNGTLVYNGERFVNVTGRQISSIPEDEVKELVEEFYKINYFSLNDTFDKIVKTDQPTVITSININGTFKSIFDNLGAIAPEGLRLLENRIDEITNSSKWVEPYVHPQGEPIR
ncbi:MAG TPA: DUF6438 domain-containing protein [Nitrososphaeraceae archaeon]|nr:DUF6438 domain-containing protein [Nitrososphaeraceae archaeon]